jgi:hypothetical protein
MAISSRWVWFTSLSAEASLPSATTMGEKLQGEIGLFYTLCKIKC